MLHDVRGPVHARSVHARLGGAPGVVSALACLRPVVLPAKRPCDHILGLVYRLCLFTVEFVVVFNLLGGLDEWLHGPVLAAVLVLLPLRKCVRGELLGFLRARGHHAAFFVHNPWVDVCGRYLERAEVFNIEVGQRKPRGLRRRQIGKLNRERDGRQPVGSFLGCGPEGGEVGAHGHHGGEVLHLFIGRGPVRGQRVFRVHSGEAVKDRSIVNKTDLD
mmetsp:Transcript_7529/g.33230  ORF Transcript_7529/g.33230 Transcript_7529/m.33230 type:complete len:218 (+) Transcript_7529:1104-1757(+)